MALDKEEPVHSDTVDQNVDISTLPFKENVEDKPYIVAADYEEFIDRPEAEEESDV